MRVVDVTSFFSDSCGGIKTYYQAKARYLPALGVDCHFVVPGARRSEEGFEAAVLHRLPGPRLPGNSQYRLFGRLRAVIDLVARLAPDVVEVGSHYLLPGAIERLRWQRSSSGARPRPRLVGFFHSDIAGTLVAPLAAHLPALLRRQLLAAVWRWVRRQHQRYDATLVASPDTASELEAHGLPGVRCVGLGVDTEVFHPGAAPPGADRLDHPLTVVYSGRLSADKSLSLLLSAWDGIHRQTGARLRVLGQGPQHGRVMHFAASRPHVSVEGYVADRAAVAAALAGADAVVTPGARETFSLSTAEALACGTPVVAPAAGGAGALVTHSGGGLCFRPDDAEALAGAAVQLLSLPPAERTALGARGRAHMAAHHGWPAVCRRILAAYREPSGGHGARAAA
jgi:alpha-1,6-mannosyltransferase